MCELYQNRLVYMIAFGIDCNLFIVLPIPLKTCRSNDFFFFTRQNMRAKKMGLVSEVLPRLGYWPEHSFYLNEILTKFCSRLSSCK